MSSLVGKRPCPNCGVAINVPIPGPGPESCTLCGWHRTSQETRIVAVPMTVAQFQLPDVLAALGTLMDWPYPPSMVPPSKSALVRAREVVLGVGPLAPGGPPKVTLAPSSKGGLVVTFFLADNRDVSVACMNNKSTLFFVGKSWTGRTQSEEIPHSDAIERARALLRSDHGAPFQPSTTRYRQV